MARFIISFNEGDMKFPPEDLPTVAEDSHKVLREAKAAGVWIFGGGFHDYQPVVVSEDGLVSLGPLAQSPVHLGGFSVIEVDAKEDAYFWAAKIAKGCRCPQEVREIMDDPESVN